ncbi:MAG: ATP-binding protein [Bacteroidales bacterium]
MRNIYETRQNVRTIFIIISLILVGVFLYISNSLMSELANEERNKMEIWAEATRQLAGNDSDTDMGLVLKVIQSNTTIPVVIMDEENQLLWHINFEIPTSDTLSYLQKKAIELRKKENIIEVMISDNVSQYLYYDDSNLLKRLSYYPYIQLTILLLFILIAFFAFSSTKKAEQNQVWVGLSKETAHQLGTPISSLMAWMDFLKEMDINQSILTEMEKDINRLNTIAERFSKIGSEPKLERVNIVNVIAEVKDYMQRRISSKTSIQFTYGTSQIFTHLSTPLFEWVIENLIKNSIDATNGSGNITISLFEKGDRIILEIKDDGKGILKSKFNTVFHPGYTTKKRGWGLGLTLVKRIVEEYHHGKIFVKESIPYKSTVFRIELRKD